PAATRCRNRAVTSRLSVMDGRAHERDDGDTQIFHWSGSSFGESSRDGASSQAEPSEDGAPTTDSPQSPPQGLSQSSPLSSAPSSPTPPASAPYSASPYSASHYGAS